MEPIIGFDSHDLDQFDSPGYKVEIEYRVISPDGRVFAHTDFVADGPALATMLRPHVEAGPDDTVLGWMQTTITERLEYLRGELRNECISYGELAELHGLASHITPGDVELLEAAGVPEFDDEPTPVTSDPQWTVRVEGEKVFTGTYADASRRADSEGEWRPDVKVTLKPAKVKTLIEPTETK